MSRLICWLRKLFRTWLYIEKVWNGAGLSWNKRRLIASTWGVVMRIWQMKIDDCKRRWANWELWRCLHSSTWIWVLPLPWPCALSVSASHHPLALHLQLLLQQVPVSTARGLNTLDRWPWHHGPQSSRHHPNLPMAASPDHELEGNSAILKLGCSQFSISMGK